MDPLTGAMLASAGANVVGGFLGGKAAEKDRDKQYDMLNRIYSMYAGIELPDIDKMKMTPEEYQLQGMLDPRMESAHTLGPGTAYEDINLDPRLRQAQMDQLKMLETVQQTGATPVEKAAIADMIRKQESSANAMMQQQLQDQERRGVGSSNAALASRMIAGQQSANRASETGQNIAAQMFQNKLNAGSNAANLAGSMSAADYSRAANIAQSKEQNRLQDFLSKVQTDRNNVSAFNAAQAGNLGAKQTLSNANVDVRNKGTAYNKGLSQTDFDNKLRRAGGMAGAGGNMASMYGNSADRTAAAWSGGAAGLGNIFMGGAQAMQKQKNFDRYMDSDNTLNQGREKMLPWID